MTPLTRNFTLDELCTLRRHPDNKPTIYEACNLMYGCALILQPLREAIASPVIITSGFRHSWLNRQVGGVPNSQHLIGCAADLKFTSAAAFDAAVNWLKHCPHVDQLLTATTWLHVSWTPTGTPRQDFRIGYYK